MNRKKLAAVCVIIITCLPQGACSSPAQEPINFTPLQIRGAWVTNDDRYAGKKLEFLEKAILIYTEEETFDPYLIKGIRIEPSAEGTAYEIDHFGPEGWLGEAPRCPGQPGFGP